MLQTGAAFLVFCPVNEVYQKYIAIYVTVGKKQRALENKTLSTAFSGVAKNFKRGGNYNFTFFEASFLSAEQI